MEFDSPHQLVATTCKELTASSHILKVSSVSPLSFYSPFPLSLHYPFTCTDGSILRVLSPLVVNCKGHSVALQHWEIGVWTIKLLKERKVSDVSQCMEDGGERPALNSLDRVRRL